MAVALGLDVGERRIGVARSDPWGLLATPLTAVLRTSDRAAVAAIGRLAEAEGATLLVVGLPLAEDGSHTAQAERVAAFAGKLRALAGKAVVFWDERHSTAEAGERLRQAGGAGAGLAREGAGRGRAGRGAGRARRAVGGGPPSARAREAARRREDAAAAAVILQDYLDQQHRERPVPLPADESSGGSPGDARSEGL